MSFSSGGFYDQPSGGGGPQSGQTASQVESAIRRLVAGQALSGNTQAWPSSKVTVGNSDTIAEGSTNLYFTTERALAAEAIPLTFGAVTGQANTKLRTVAETGGNAIDIPSGAEHGAAEGGLLFELNGFYAEVPFDEIIDLPVTAANDTAFDTSGNTANALLHRSSSLGNGDESIYVGRTSADKLLLLGVSNDGTNRTDTTDDIKLYNLEHAHRGSFHRNDPTGTIADDDYLVFFDTSESFSPPKRIAVSAFKTFLGNQTGGGGTITATQLEALIDDTQGNVDAALNSDSSKVVLTATVQGGGGGTFTLTQANLRPVLDTTLLVDSTLSKTVSTANNTITLGVAQAATGSHNFYVGHRSALSFAAPTLWSPSEAENTYDVSQAGSTITVDITNIPDDDYVYLVAPQDREPTSVIDSVGAESVNDFAEQVGAVTVSGTTYNVYTVQNQSGRNVPSIRYIITVE